MLARDALLFNVFKSVTKLFNSWETIHEGLVRLRVAKIPRVLKDLLLTEELTMGHDFLRLLLKHLGLDKCFKLLGVELFIDKLLFGEIEALGHHFLLLSALSRQTLDHFNKFLLGLRSLFCQNLLASLAVFLTLAVDGHNSICSKFELFGFLFNSKQCSVNWQRIDFDDHQRLLPGRHKFCPFRSIFLS